MSARLGQVLLVAGTVLSRPVLAQEQAPVERARELSRAAVAHFERGEDQQAYAAYLQAWRLHPHYQIACNLGQVELALGKHADAAEHLRFCLRQEHDPELRAREEAAFAQALGQVATVHIAVQPTGAAVRVNGVLVGQAPLTEPVFVAPGNAAIEAQLSGYELARKTVLASKGETVRVSLSLVSERDPAGRSVALGTTPGHEPQPFTAPSGPPALEARRSAAPIWIGGAVAITGLACGIIFHLKANASESRRDDELRAIDAASGANGCGSGTTLKSRCEALNDRNHELAQSRNWATAGWVTFGAAGLATFAYWLITKPASNRAAHSGINASATVTPRGGSLLLNGHF